VSLLRYDVTTHDWVVFAPERGRRPQRLGEEAALPKAGRDPECPFCPGNERLTPSEILAFRDEPSPGWKVRVVPNKFPALGIEEDPRRQEEGALFRRMGGCGAHEVVIESPEHATFLGHQPVEQIERVLRALQLRFNDLLRDDRFQAIIPFKNHGRTAGSSLDHPHWQMIATPVVPHLLRIRHAIATEYFDATGRCLYSALLEEELAAGERVLATNPDFAALLPYASHDPFETWILPRVRESSFGRVSGDLLRSLAGILKTVLSKLYVGLGNPDFNLVLNTVARGDVGKRYFLWHIQILPRLTTHAGFEIGSGMTINPILPEEAARYLREIRTP
jgi:UDPglucose--hexose-1-phosphate uridylyltransferase